MVIMMNFLLIISTFLSCGTMGQGIPGGGVKIVKKEEYVEPKVDPERGNYEIYTSMQQLEEFFMQEMEYVEDLRTLYDKKLISSDDRGGIGGYIQSFEVILISHFIKTLLDLQDPCL